MAGGGGEVAEWGKLVENHNPISAVMYICTRGENGRGVEWGKTG